MLLVHTNTLLFGNFSFFFSSFLSALLFVIHSVSPFNIKNLHSTLRLSLSRSMLLFAMRINKISFERISSSAVQRKPIQYDRYNSMQVNGKIFFSNPNKKKTFYLKINRKKMKLGLVGRCTFKNLISNINITSFLSPSRSSHNFESCHKDLN